MTLSSAKHRHLISRLHVVILGVMAILSVSVYLIAAKYTFHIGFPMDESWIYQVYARNLALNGDWAFRVGQSSTGITAPFWSLLVSLGYWLDLAPYFWTFLLGMLILFALACEMEISARRMSPFYQPRFPWIGTLTIMEWHLVWAAASGMETLLFSLFVTRILLMLVYSRRYTAIGILIGLSTWLRPEGITLLGPSFLVLILTESTWKDRFRRLGGLLMGFMPLFCLYLGFNLFLGGMPWPNSFYARQEQYAYLLHIPFMGRIYNLMMQPLIGVGLSLILGVFLETITAIRSRNWSILAGMTWCLGHVILYTVRLPIVFPHGRYLIPVIPFFLFWGAMGLMTFLQKSSPAWQKTLDSAWRMLTVTLLFLFWLMGAGAYGQDVAVIESENVAVAKWLAGHIPQQAGVAAPEIGALGYFGEFDVTDLSGRISPEVINLLGDDVQLGGFLSDSQADYLAAFSDWHPDMTRDLRVIFRTDGAFALKQGLRNMNVYSLSRP